jgi:hypothetical protein
MKDPLFDLLVRTVLERLSEHFTIPTSMTEKERDSFVFRTLEDAAIVPAKSLHSLLEVAGEIVARWEKGDLAEAVRHLSSGIDNLTARLTGEAVRRTVFIICQRGLVQEVVGMAESEYEICDCDAFEGVTEGNAEKYFDGLSRELQAYLRTTGWNKEVPRSRREVRDQL